MAYIPLAVPDRAPAAISAVIKDGIDPFLEDFHYLVSVRHPAPGPRGSMQRPLAIVLMAAADGAAQLLHPVGGGIGDRFQSFFRTYYPWDADPPDGLSIEEACTHLWSTIRCPLLHRFGLRHAPEFQSKLGNVFALMEEDVEQIERGAGRPHSDPSVRFGDGRLILWLEGFYWGLRRAIEGATRDEARWASMEQWIIEGRYDQHRAR